MSYVKKDITFLDLDVALCNERLESIINVKSTLNPHIHSIQKDLLYLAKLYMSVEFVFVKTTFDIIASK